MPLIHKLKKTSNVIAIGRRFCASSSSNVKTPGSRYVKPATGVRKYALDKYFGFMPKYLEKIEHRFPKAYRVYQVFSFGVMEFYKDFKQYLSISSQLRNGKAVRELSLKELETYYQMPKDIIKVAPVLLISLLPLANYVVFPVAYMFPHVFLSRHFWSINEKFSFSFKEHKKRLYNYKPVFRQLQAKSLLMKNVENQSELLTILYKLGSGIHPDVEEILMIKSLFVDTPFGLSHLSSRHLAYLCRLHNISAMLGKRRRLYNQAGFIREMDLAIKREGISNMETVELRSSCLLRGLNPVGLPREDLISWLNQWITITESLDRHSLSLLLHCPIFLSYNHPTNWSMIH